MRSTALFRFLLSTIFFSHQISTSHKSPINQQYFSLAANQHQPQPAEQSNTSAKHRWVLLLIFQNSFTSIADLRFMYNDLWQIMTGSYFNIS